MPHRSEPTQASGSRIYNYLLGGNDYYTVDQEAGDAFEAVVPNARNSARATRGVVLRATRYMAEQGIDQFLDIGCGIPLWPNVHDIAREVVPDARVAYVDKDPVVIAKSDALRDEPGLITVPGDLRDPGAIVKNPKVAGLLDFTRPVGVLVIAVLHFVTEDPAPYQAQLRDALAPGSYLALTHASTEHLPEDQIAGGEAVYRQTASPVVARDLAEITALFKGFDLVEPGLVPLHEWRPHPADPYPEHSPEALAGVGIRR